MQVDKNISEDDLSKLNRYQRRALAAGGEPPASLPDTGFLRIKQILKYIPVSKATFWNGVSSGRFPKPIAKRAGERATFWRVEDIRALIADMGSEA